jgi:hypothetical protein
VLLRRNQFEDKDIIYDSIIMLDDWITSNNWKDYDPFDGLSSRYADLITLNNHYLR